MSANIQKLSSIQLMVIEVFTVSLLNILSV